MELIVTCIKLCTFSNNIQNQTRKHLPDKDLGFGGNALLESAEMKSIYNKDIKK